MKLEEAKFWKVKKKVIKDSKVFEFVFGRLLILIWKSYECSKPISKN